MTNSRRYVGTIEKEKNTLTPHILRYHYHQILVKLVAQSELHARCNSGNHFKGYRVSTLTPPYIIPVFGRYAILSVHVSPGADDIHTLQSVTSYCEMPSSVQVDSHQVSTGVLHVYLV